MLEISQEWLLHITPFRLKETTTPTDAEVAPNWVAFYAKDSSGTSTLCYKNDAGTEVCLPTTGTIVTGTGTANKLAMWTGTSTIGNLSNTLTQHRVLVADVNGLPTNNAALTADQIVYPDANGELTGQAAIKRSGTTGSLILGSDPVGITTPGLVATPATGLSSGASIFLIGVGTGLFGNYQARSARGVAGTLTASQSGDVLARFSGVGYGATSFPSSFRAAIDYVAAENWTDTAQGTYIKWATTPTGSVTSAERFRIGPSGQLGIGGATFGTALDVFTSGGASAAPTWTSPGALTKTDDTNVTLTLGGTPATALLRAASLTLGWTGTLAVARGGTGLSSISGDWLSQYALLAGRSGGQTLIGGTAASDTLTVKSTSNATKGDIILDGGDLTFTSSMRARMSAQNRFRYLNIIGQFSMSTTSAAITTNVATAVSFDTEQIDTDGLHSTVTNNSRITVPITGKYLVCANTGWTANATGRRGLLLKKNGTTFIGAGQYIQACAADETIAAASWIVSLAASDYVEIFAQQFSGGNLTLLGDDTFQNFTSASICYVGE